MKLYFSPFSCALAVRIAAYEANQPISFEQIDLSTKEIKAGGDYHAVNAKGLVPALLLDDGTVLTENAAILQYMADLAPDCGLAPAPASLDRVKLQAWLNYIATEVHKVVYSPIFRPNTPMAVCDYARANAASRFDYLEATLRERTWLMGDQFTVADAYLAVMLLWAEPAGLDLADWPGLTQYLSRLRDRPAVTRALAHEIALKMS